MALPLVVAVFAVPLLIAGMGTERFGLLAIIWMGIGYFSLFDMGLGRALTKLVAERLGWQESDDLRQLVWTALWIILSLGVVAATVVNLAAGWLVTQVLNVPEELLAEAELAIRVLAVGIPLVVLTSALVGILEAHQQFPKIARVRIPLGMLTFLGPLVALQFTPNLVAATTILLGGRVLAFGLFFSMVRATVPGLGLPMLPIQRLVRPLLSFGGWLTVTNIVGPIMVYFDRFLIGALLTMSAVTYYVTPYEVLSRLFILPQAVMGVLFPALATAYVADRDRLVAIFGRATHILLLIMLSPVTFAVLFASEGLGAWLGEEFRVASTLVVQWLAVGVLINTLARVPFVALQSAGRPDLVAKVHLAELIPYIFVLMFLINQYGITGAAMAWTLRIIIDTVALTWLAGWVIKEVAPITRRILLQIPVFVLLLLFFTILDHLTIRLAITVIVTSIVAILLWREIRWGQSPISEVVTSNLAGVTTKK